MSAAIKHPVAPHSCPWCGRARHGNNPFKSGDGLYIVCSDCGRSRRAYQDPASGTLGRWERYDGPRVIPGAMGATEDAT